MKHSAKGIAKLARERERQARLAAAEPAEPAEPTGPAGPMPAAPMPADPKATAGPGAEEEGAGRDELAAPALLTRESAPLVPEPAAQHTDPAERMQRAAGPAPMEDESWAADLPVTARSATAIEARPRPGARRLSQLPYALVLAGVLAGLGLMRSGMQDVKSGTLVIAGALLAGSLARLVLPDGRAGLLGSRRRLVDVAALTVLGVGLLIAGLIVRVAS